jgi:hypothetical protein
VEAFAAVVSQGAEKVEREVAAGRSRSSAAEAACSADGRPPGRVERLPGWRALWGALLSVLRGVLALLVCGMMDLGAVGGIAALITLERVQRRWPLTLLGMSTCRGKVGRVLQGPVEERCFADGQSNVS